jgi:hypothetical protein
MRPIEATILEHRTAAVLRPLLSTALRLEGDTLAYGEWLAIERRFHEAGIEARAHARGVFVPPGVDLTFNVAESSFNAVPHDPFNSPAP